MAAALSLNATYHKASDFVEVSFYKHDNNTQENIVAGSISLKQNGQVLSSIDVDNRSKFVTFFHPKGLSNLKVEANIDSLTLEVDVKAYDFDTPIDGSIQSGRPADIEFEWKEPQIPIIDTSKRVPNSTILALDFNESPNLEYSGGNRVIFDYNNKLVHQPVDKLIDAPKYSEVGTTNLIGDLEDLFEYTYPFSAVNQYVKESEFGYDQLMIRALGASQGDNTQVRTFSAQSDIYDNCASIQFFLAFNRALSVETFQFIIETLDVNDAVLTTTPATLQVADYVSNYGLVSGAVATGSRIRFRIEIPGLYPIDNFDMFILMPMVNNLPSVSTYTPGIRIADVFKYTGVVFDYKLSKIEIELQSGNNSPGVLFDAGTIKAEYDGTNLSFTVNGTIITTPYVLSSATKYLFELDTYENELRISANGSPLTSGGAGFNLTSNTDLYIGCDNMGANQINAQIYAFKILN